jgi:hypothetical protein
MAHVGSDNAFAGSVCMVKADAAAGCAMLRPVMARTAGRTARPCAAEVVLDVADLEAAMTFLDNRCGNIRGAAGTAELLHAE